MRASGSRRCRPDPVESDVGEVRVEDRGILRVTRPVRLWGLALAAGLCVAATATAGPHVASRKGSPRRRPHPIGGATHRRPLFRRAHVEARDLLAGR